MAILYDNEGNQINMSEVAANTSDISNLKSRVTTAEGDISTLETTTTGLVDNKEILGAKNLMPLNLAQIKTSNTTGTWNDNVYTLNDVTFTFNTDGNGNITSIVGNGQASSVTRLILTSDFNFIVGSSYILNGCTDGLSGTTPLYFIFNERFDPIYQTDSEVTLTTGETSRSGRFFIYVAQGVTLTNQPFYPMIRLATDNNPTFEPYAMSNQELTSKVLDLITRVTALET